MAGVAFAVDGDGVGFATESYAASALYATLANLSGAFWRIRRANRVGLGVNDTARAERALKGVVGKRLTYRTTSRTFPWFESYHATFLSL
jgi:hypothetical protein